MTAYDAHEERERERVREGEREKNTLIDICTIDTQLATGFQEVLPTLGAAHRGELMSLSQLKPKPKPKPKLMP